jgi:hypothetical protein
LHLDTVLLAIEVALIRTSTIVTSVAVRLRRVRRRGLSVVVVDVGLLRVVAGHGARGPACAVERLATCFAAATSCETTSDEMLV